MASWTEEQGLKWRARAPFGVEIDHDLSQPLEPAAAKRFVKLFHDFGMIVATGQTLDMQQQIAVMGRLGHVLRSFDGTGYITTEGGGTWVRSELTFHADYAFTPYPLDGLSLHAVDVVDGASATRFANAERGWAILPQDLRERLEGRPVELISPDLTGVAFRTCEVREPKALLGDIRPAVLANPRNGRACINVGEMHAKQIVGLDWEESRDLLNAVYDHIYAPDNVTEHAWRRGDIVMWDNYTFQHARAPLEGVGRRVLQRVVIGEKSIAEMSPDAAAAMAA
jgi:taurine dioxygenase